MKIYECINFILPTISMLLGFQIFWLCVYLMNVILETRRAH